MITIVMAICFCIMAVKDVNEDVARPFIVAIIISVAFETVLIFNVINIIYVS